MKEWSFSSVVCESIFFHLMCGGSVEKSGVAFVQYTEVKEPSDMVVEIFAPSCEMIFL